MADNQTINEEAGLGPNWVPVDSAPIIPGKSPMPSSVSVQGTSARYLQGSIPPSFQHDVNFVETAEPKSDKAPRFSLMPLGLQASPVSNSAIESTTKIIAAASGGPAGITSVGLTVPQELVVSGSPLSPPGGVIGLKWASEPANLIFSGPPIPGLATDASGSASLTQPTGTGTISIAVTPNNPTTFAIYASLSNNTLSPSPPTGFAFIGSLPLSFKNLTNNSPLTVSQSVSGAANAISGLNLFQGAFTSLTQSATAVINDNSTHTISLPGAATLNNTIMVLITGSSSGSKGISPVVVGDNLGNTYFPIQVLSQGFVSVGGTPQIVLSLYLVPRTASGTLTLTYQMSGTFQPAHTGNIWIAEFAAFPAGTGIPGFRPLNLGDIPAINLSIHGNGGVSGILGEVNGGVGIDLTQTGGISQFLKQASFGGAVTVVQPDFSDLAGAAGQFPSLYNGVTLVSNGIPSEIATSDLTAQTTAVGPTTLKSAPASGMYRISYVAKVTTASSGTSVLGGTNGFQIVYTDANDSVVVTTPAWWGGGNNGAAPTSASLNTTQTYISGDFIINAKTGTDIRYQFDYTSTGLTVMQYNLHVKLEAL